jgi:hypothetical protein
MHLLGNLYFVLGVIFILVIVLQAPNYSSMKKIGILLVTALILLYVEKPDWLVDSLRNIRIGY